MTLQSHAPASTATDTPRRTVLALRHVYFEDLGTFEPPLTARGCDIRYLDAGIDNINDENTDTADLMVVLGGPVGVYDAARYPFVDTTKAAIARRIRAERPILGVCLGAQLIAEAMGARVYSTGTVEIGYAPLQLTAEGRESALRELDGTPVLHRHGDQFDIPDGARHLAGTATFPNQAFTNDNVLALQFQLESNHRVIEQWLIGHAYELHHNNIDPDRIRTHAHIHGPEIEKVAAKTLEHWLDELADPGATTERRTEGNAHTN